MATFTVTISNLTPDDVRGGLGQISRSNATTTILNNAIIAANEATDPVGTTPLLPLLPIGTAAEKKSSYESLLANEVLANAHVGYVKEAMRDESRLNDAQKLSLRDAINLLLDSGLNPAQILTKLMA